MDFMEAIKRRHAVRSYEDRPIAADARHELQELLSQLNLESGLSMQLVLNEQIGRASCRERVYREV